MRNNNRISVTVAALGGCNTCQDTAYTSTNIAAYILRCSFINILQLLTKYIML